MNNQVNYTLLTPIELVRAINSSGQNILQYQQAEAEYRNRLKAIPVQQQRRPYPELIFELGFYAGNTEIMATDLNCEGIYHEDDGNLNYRTLPYIDTSGIKRMLCPACATKA